MRTGQRDVHNTPLKRRLSITYEELETLKKSIKVSVLNELRAETDNVSDQDSIKDLVLSEIRTELMGIPNPALLKASILNELKMELKISGEHYSEAADRKLRELTGIQDGLVRELLDQKMLIKKLETEIGNLSKQLEHVKKTASAALPAAVSPSITFALPEDPLDLPPLSRKPKQKPEPRKENPAAYRLTGFREAPAPLPGTGAKVQLKLKEVEPAELDKEEVETKCEYIIAESGDKRRLKGTVRQQSSIRTEPPRQQSSIRTEPLRQQPPIRIEPPRQQPPGPSFPVRQPAAVRTDPARTQPSDDYKCEYIIAEKTSKRTEPPRQQPPGSSFPSRQSSAVRTDPARAQPADDYKCEYIIAEKTSKKHFIEESVDVRDNEDAEIITCNRKNSGA